MDKEILHKKVLDYSAKNKEALSKTMNSLSELTKNHSQQSQQKYQSYLSEYNELLKLNKESEEENYRLKKELALIQIEIEELSFRNQLNKSRIKNQNDEIQNIKDETFDIDLQKKKKQSLKKQMDDLQREK